MRTSGTRCAGSLLTAELVELPERFAAFAARVDKFIDTQQGVNDRVESRLDGIDTRLETISKDLGNLKGHAAGRAARDHVETILDALGLTYADILRRGDLVSLMANASDIATGDRQSFYRADLVAEARDADGSPCYVAVEASYTADRRDSDRALRNAGFLTRCTGLPAHAVVASLRNDKAVQALVDAGTIHWHRLTDRDLDPE